MAAADLERRIDDLIGRFHMHGIADRPALGFSQGERMKVALARAIVHDPPNVLLDEPGNGLDVPSARTLRALLAAFRAAGKCVILSSHVMAEIAAGGICCLDDMRQEAWMVVFRKEMVDTLRDRGSLFMAFLFCWLGPLVAAFTSAVPLAIDSMAGERERGSLEPLLLNAVPPAELVVGKWLAAVMLSFAAVVFNLLCTAIVVNVTPLGKLPAASLLWMCAAVAPLCILASGLQLLISTFARSHKQAHSYLSFLILAPMMISILGEFFPGRLRWITAIIPVLGQQRILSGLVHGQAPHLPWLLAAGVCSVLGGLITVAVNARLLRSEKVVFGR
jgi:ABC-type Na+ efflux pump permease subunit